MVSSCGNPRSPIPPGAARRPEVLHMVGVYVFTSDFVDSTVCKVLLFRARGAGHGALIRTRRRSRSGRGRAGSIRGVEAMRDARAEAMRVGQRRRPNRAAPDGPQRPARRPQGEALRSARRQASARGGEPSGPLRKTSGVRCAAKQASNTWPEVANAGGTARRGCPRGWDREREEAKAGVAPPSRRAPRDRRAGAPARGPAFAIPATVARAGRRTSRARRRKSGECPATDALRDEKGCGRLSRRFPTPIHIRT